MKTTRDYYEEEPVAAMPKVVILTEVKCSDGSRHTRFTVKDDNKPVAYVRRNGEGKYEVWAGWPFLDEIGSRTKKDAAIELAKKSVLKMCPNAEFKLNVITERVR